MGNHKKVMCNVCYREMRSDVLKRHMKQHSKKNESVPATNILVTNNIYNNPPSVSTSDPIKRLNEKSKINIEELENSIVNDDHEYEQKFELGKAIHEIVIRRGVRQQSLRPECKEALDLYMKESVKLFPENIELKPWQISVVE